LNLHATQFKQRQSFIQKKVTRVVEHLQLVGPFNS